MAGFDNGWAAGPADDARRSRTSAVLRLAVWVTIAGLITALVIWFQWPAGDDDAPAADVLGRALGNDGGRAPDDVVLARAQKALPDGAAALVGLPGREPATDLGSSIRRPRIELVDAVSGHEQLVTFLGVHDRTTAVAGNGAWAVVSEPRTGPPWRAAGLAALAAVLMALVAALLVAGLRRAPAAASTPAPTAPAPGPPPGPPPAPEVVHVTPPETVAELDRLRAVEDQRLILARGLAEMISQMPDSLSWQASNVLSDAGVTVLVPDGQPFDPTKFHAVGSEPGPMSAADTVARTVRPGYADGSRILVAPKVVVYDGATGPAPSGERT